MESSWKLEMVRAMMTGLVEDTVTESGRKLFEKITLNVVVARSWESL